VAHGWHPPPVQVQSPAAQVQVARSSQVIAQVAPPVQIIVQLAPASHVIAQLAPVHPTSQSARLWHVMSHSPPVQPASHTAPLSHSMSQLEPVQAMLQPSKPGHTHVSADEHTRSPELPVVPPAPPSPPAPPTPSGTVQSSTQPPGSSAHAAIAHPRRVAFVRMALAWRHAVGRRYHSLGCAIAAGPW
jgi:hypothetical protein